MGRACSSSARCASGSGKVVDARDEGELGVSASVRSEGGGGKDHPGFLRSGRGFYGRWNRFYGRRLGFPA